MAKQIVLVLSLITVGFFFMQKKKPESIPSQIEKPIESSAKPIVESRSAIFRPATIVTAKPTLVPFLSSLKHVDEMPQAELQNLYREMQAMISSHPEETLGEIRKGLQQSLKLPLENGFFLTSSWVRYAPNPTTIIDALWDKKLAPLKADVHDTHHTVMDESEKLERMKSYALVELRKRNQESGLTAETEFLNQLSHLAATEKSYDISLEALQLLQELKRDDLVENALKKRNKVEQKVLSGVIKLHDVL